MFGVLVLQRLVVDANGEYCNSANAVHEQIVAQVGLSQTPHGLDPLRVDPVDLCNHCPAGRIACMYRVELAGGLDVADAIHGQDVDRRSGAAELGQLAVQPRGNRHREPVGDDEVFT